LKDRRRHLVVIGCILAALVGVAFLAAPSSPVHKKLTLGLDLQGGLEVVLKAVPPKGHKLTADDLTRSIDIMRQRIDKTRGLGAGDPEAGLGTRSSSSSPASTMRPGRRS